MNRQSQAAFDPQALEIFLVSPPGLERALVLEAQENSFEAPRVVTGGVTIRGDWSEVWRANLLLRGAGQTLVRIASFRVVHLAQLDKLSRREIPWRSVLPPSSALRIEAAARRSKLYHTGAIAQRLEAAACDAVGARIDPEAAVRVLARLDRDVCTVSVDASGAPLHRRGWKQQVGKAPLRETMAALMLRNCGFHGAEPVVDPMCGSGTFVLEAADMALRLPPGRARRFAFEELASFDAPAWEAMRAAAVERRRALPDRIAFHGFDRDAGAIAGCRENAARAGVQDAVVFRAQSISALTPPPGPTGLVMVNPPYGERIGDFSRLRTLYGALGGVLRERFAGWRVGLVTNDRRLAAATGLAFADADAAPIAHGGLKIRLYRTEALP